MTDAVGSLNWISHTEKESERLGTWPTPDAHNDVADRPIFQEQSEIYLPKLPSFPKRYNTECHFRNSTKKSILLRIINILCSYLLCYHFIVFFQLFQFIEGR